MHLQDIITQQIIELTCTYEMVLHDKLLNSHAPTKWYYTTNYWIHMCLQDIIIKWNMI